VRAAKRHDADAFHGCDQSRVSGKSWPSRSCTRFTMSRALIACRSLRPTRGWSSV
jgi:hypothetical protein